MRREIFCLFITWRIFLKSAEGQMPLEDISGNSPFGNCPVYELNKNIDNTPPQFLKAQNEIAVFSVAPSLSLTVISGNFQYKITVTINRKNRVTAEFSPASEGSGFLYLENVLDGEGRPYLVQFNCKDSSNVISSSGSTKKPEGESTSHIAAPRPTRPHSTGFFPHPYEVTWPHFVPSKVPFSAKRTSLQPSSTTESSTYDYETTESTISTGVIVGICIGAFVLIAVIAINVFYLIRHKTSSVSESALLKGQDKNSAETHKVQYYSQKVTD